MSEDEWGYDDAFALTQRRTAVIAPALLGVGSRVLRLRDQAPGHA